jgi:hypothetical protein
MNSRVVYVRRFAKPYRPQVQGKRKPSFFQNYSTLQIKALLSFETCDSITLLFRVSNPKT